MKKKTYILTFLMMLCSLVFGQTTYHWEQPMGWESNMIVYGKVLIDGQAPAEDLDLELGAFCGNQLRGRQKVNLMDDIELVINGNDGNAITFKLCDKDGDLLDYECVTTINFVANGIIQDQVINFKSSNHWNPAHNTNSNMTVTAKVTINGANVNGDYEIGAFIGDNVCGSARVNNSIAYIVISNNLDDNGNPINGTNNVTFKLWDHQNDALAEEITDVTLNYGHNATQGTITEPYVINFNLPVAKVESKEFATLQAAVNATTSDNTEVIILRDFTLDNTVTIANGQTVVLNLGSKTVTTAWENESAKKHYYAFTNNGTLTIKGEGTINARGIFNYGTMTLTNGTINAIDGNGGYGVRNYAGSVFTMNGGIIATTLEDDHKVDKGGYDATTLRVDEGATAIINGGVINNICDYTFAIDNYGTVTVTVNAGTVTSVHSTVSNYGTMTINGGSFTCNGLEGITAHALVAWDGSTTTINGGTFDGKDNYNGFNVDAEEGAVVTITGGEFLKVHSGSLYGEGTITVSGGTFFDEVKEARLAQGYICEKEGEVYKVVRGLKGEGTEEKPFIIMNLDDLVFFRDHVNGGGTKYNATGKWVALGANIDMAGVNWVGIGSAYADHGFMGNFDGKTYTISNLTITNPAIDSDGYAYAGLFAVTEGTDKNNQNVIKNLTIENVTISTTGHIVAAAIAYPYYTVVEKVTVKGNIAIKGGDYTAGALAYTRRCVNASNIAVAGNDGSSITGARVVGGVISDIQMNGELTANYSNFSASNVKISGEMHVGGISGIIGGQTLDGATVKNVTLNCNDSRVGVVSGSLGVASTISTVVAENVTGATAIIGATYDNAKAIEAKIGDTYYATLEGALKSDKGNNVTLLVPYTVEAGETVELDLNDKTVTGTPTEAAAYAVITNNGTLTIKNGSIICDHKLAGSTGYAVNTITNCGTLTIDDATIENKSTASNQIGYAIDNNSTSANAVLVVESGKVIASGSNYYDGIRQFCNSETNENSVIINSGEVSSLWMQNPSDGTTDNNTKDVKGSFAISGGTLNALYLEPSVRFTGLITGGHVVSISRFQTAQGRDLVKFISGGTFGEAVKEEYCAEGYIPYSYTAEDGKTIHTVKLGAYVARNTTTGQGYETLRAAVEAAAGNVGGWGQTITLLKDITLEGGYDDATEGLRIEKSVTIDGNRFKIDCGDFTKGIRVYNNTNSVAGVLIKNVTIVNGNPKGSCINTRTANINLNIQNIHLIARGTNSQPLTIGGEQPAYRVDMSSAIIDAGESGYGVICFVPVQVHVNSSSNTQISGMAAFYIKHDTSKTQIDLGHGTYVGTNMHPKTSGVFGTVVIEGTENTVTMSMDSSIVKAVAGDGSDAAAQAAFLIRGEKNKIIIEEDGAQVLTEGENAYWAMIKNEVAESTEITDNGTILNPAAQAGEYQFMTLEEAVRYAKAESTVTVVNNNTVAEPVVIEKNLTLDLNGKTLSTAFAGGSTTNHIYAFDNKGTLTITDSSDAKDGKINARGIFNHGTMTLENGTINAIDGNGGYAVRNYAGATFTMNGGTIATTYEDDYQVNNGGYDATTVRVDEGAEFVMKGGTINNICDYTFAIENHGETSLLAGSVKSVHSTVSNYGTMTINGGSFTCNGLEGITAHALVAWDGSTTNITGGTFDGKDNYNGFNVCASEGAIVNITGGNFLPVHSGSLYGDGTIKVSGGTFFDRVYKERLVDGYTCVQEGEKQFTVYPISGEIPYRAYIGDESDRESVKVDLKNVYAGDSLVVKLYDADNNLLTTTTLKQGGVKAPEYYTCNIVLWGNPSSSWDTEINAEKLTVDNIPATIKLYIDGILVDTFENAFGAGTNSDVTSQYIALDCVYKEAKIGETYYASLQGAVNAAQNGDEITVIKDFTVTTTVVVDETVSIDLNDKTITGSQVLPVIRIQGNASVTVENGNITNNDGYIFILGASDSSTYGNLTIKSGIYQGATSVASVTYGTLNVISGEYSVKPYNGSYAYLINCVDANYTNDKANVSISGGIFHNWNPENNAAEGEGTNFCAVGYEAVEVEEGVFFVMPKTSITQSTDLDGGWNWFSLYVDIDGIDGLNMLRNSLTDGLEIKNSSSFTQFEEGYGWYGSLSSVSVNDMYMIHVGEKQTINLEANPVNPADYTITINENWTWIGYPSKNSTELGIALKDLNPTENDYIKSQNAFAEYTNEGWKGSLKTMIPGEGYMYKNVSGEVKTFVYSESAGAKGEAPANITAANNLMVPNMTKYANNMNITAVVNIDGEELMTEDFEVAVFAGEELRGSARPIYIESINRYMLFITVYGEENEELTFKYYDLNSGEELNLFADSKVVFEINSIIGSVGQPSVLNYGTLSIDETSASSFNVYPNPVNRDNAISFETTFDKVEVYNSLGVVVAEYANVDKIDGIEAAGIYVIKVTNDNVVKYCRVIVK